MNEAVWEKCGKFIVEVVSYKARVFEALCVCVCVYKGIYERVNAAFKLLAVIKS